MHTCVFRVICGVTGLTLCLCTNGPDLFLLSIAERERERFIDRFSRVEILGQVLIF